jgi:hypothetical protein
VFAEYHSCAFFKLIFKRFKRTVEINFHTLRNAITIKPETQSCLDNPAENLLLDQQHESALLHTVTETDADAETKVDVASLGLAPCDAEAVTSLGLAPCDAEAVLSEVDGSEESVTVGA